MDDKTLVENILRIGDTRSFAEIVHRYSGMVFSKSLGVVHDEELAAEVMQETFVKAYDRLDTWRGEHLGPWLVTIALHTAINLLDKERRRHVLSLDDVRETECGTSEPYSPQREEQLQLMERAMEQLSDSDRQLLDLHYYQQLKTDVIALRLGITQSNVLVRLHRIRERLKKLMTHE